MDEEEEDVEEDIDDEEVLYAECALAWLCSCVDESARDRGSAVSPPPPWDVVSIEETLNVE